MHSEEEAKSLQGEINRWKWGIIVAASLLVAAYAAWFGLWKAIPLAEDADKWGAFGDFLGGLMNPLVAFAAFYWLTRSVQLQKRELEETRRALEEASEAQRQQAEQSRVAIRLDALVAAHALVSNDLARNQEQQEFLMSMVREEKRTGEERIALLAHRQQVSDKGRELARVRWSYELEIQEVLRRYPLPDPTARSEDAAAPPVAPH